MGPVEQPEKEPMAPQESSPGPTWPFFKSELSGEPARLEMTGERQDGALELDVEGLPPNLVNPDEISPEGPEEVG